MSPWATLCAFAIGTTSATLAVTWPTPTHADGASPLIQYMVDGTKINDVIAKGTVHRDPLAKSGWVIDVTAHNDAAHAERLALETDLTRRVGSPMSRVAPQAQTVWSHREDLTVPAHGSVARRYELPIGVGQQLVAAEAQAAAPQTAPMPATMTSFAVAINPPSRPTTGGPLSMR